MKILLISGSLRKQSLNTQLLSAVEKITPEGVTTELFLLHELPFYNEDIDTETKPAAVQHLLDSITNADAVIFSSPEYNHSMSGVLKNAIDWASRPAFNSPLVAKPCGILTASKSPAGGNRAQADLKNVLACTLSVLYPSVECSVASAHEKFDKEGILIDEVTQKRLQRYIEGFVTWVQKQMI